MLVGVGLLLAHPLARLVSGEDGLNRELVGERSPVWTTVTGVFSALANTPAVVGVVIAVALAMRLIFGRWAESIILVTAVLLQAAVFLLTTMVVDRQRPAVEHLDPAPPTSSFPSGHTGAATALYVGIAVVIAWRVRHKLLRVLLVAVFVAVPILVAVSRLYRGMHHPPHRRRFRRAERVGLSRRRRVRLPSQICHRGARRGHADNQQVGHFAWTPPFQHRHDGSRCNFDMPEKSAETLRADGWLHTGDLATMKRAGLLPDRRPAQGYDHLRRREFLRRRDRRGLLPPSGRPRWRSTACPTSAGARRSGRSSDRAIRTRVPTCHGRRHSRYRLTGPGKIQKFAIREVWERGEHATTNSAGSHCVTR